MFGRKMKKLKETIKIQSEIIDELTDKCACLEHKVKCFRITIESKQKTIEEMVENNHKLLDSYALRKNAK